MFKILMFIEVCPLGFGSLGLAGLYRRSLIGRLTVSEIAGIFSTGFFVATKNLLLQRIICMINPGIPMEKTSKKRKYVGNNVDLLTTYAQLEEYVRVFKEGHMGLLILIGGPGLGKSQFVRQALGTKLCWIEGNASAFGLYEQLYRHKNQFVVIDDVDGLYADRNCVRLLKCVCNTDAKKRVTWHTSLSKLKREGLKPEFETTSRVVIISNDWKTLNRNIASLEDRGHTLIFEPTPQEVHKQASLWFKNQEIYDWFGENLHRIKVPTFRNYIRAAEKKAGKMDWTRVLGEVEGHRREQLVAELLTDDRYPTMTAKAKAFVMKGGGSESTFWNYRRQLAEKQI